MRQKEVPGSLVPKDVTVRSVRRCISVKFMENQWQHPLIKWAREGEHKTIKQGIELKFMVTTKSRKQKSRRYGTT